MGLERFTKKGVALRKSPRERKEHVVRLELDGGAPSLSGVLSDLSATGARISLAAPYAMPAKFALVLSPGARRLCRLVWQSQENLGVEFLGAATRAPAKAVGQIQDPPQPLPQPQPQKPQQSSRGPAAGKPGSTGPRGSLPLWNYSDNQRTKRK
jgi:PilZ domain